MHIDTNAFLQRRKGKAISTEPEVIKLFSCSTQLILNAHKYKNVKKFGFFSDSDKSRMLFFLSINVKMPTTVGILTFMSRKISCSVELSMK